MQKLYYLVLLTLLFICGNAYAQSTVSGTVTASDGSKLPGVNVLIKGSSLGTITDMDGNFSLSVDPEAVLVFSFVGFNRKEVPVAGKTKIDVELAEDATELTELVVLGSRGAGRTKIETAAPVDVININQMASSMPQTDLSQMLVATAPSFSAVKSQGGDLNSHVTPPTLRGLAPNQMLVLINGKRRHTSALLNASQTGTYANAVDMSFIPSSAVGRVEILRDGAAAQYGSDAIAGVMNIVLKETTGQLTGNLTVGAYPNIGTPKFENNYGGLTAGEKALQDEVPRGIDGESYTFDANYGIGLGRSGYLNITGMLRQDKPAIRPTVLDYARYEAYDGTYLTNQRTDKYGNPIITNPELLIALSEGSYKGYTPDELSTNYGLMQARGLTQYDLGSYLGQPGVNLGAMSFNMAVPLVGDFEFYANGDIGFKNIEGFSCYYRSPSWTSRASAFGLYPNGFRPQMITTQVNTAASVGVQGKIGEFNVDVSNTLGRNAMDIRMDHTINNTYGDQSPTNMYLGQHSFLQNTSNVDVSRFFADALNGLNVGFGVEMRVENYQINRGQPESWTNSDAGIYTATSTDELLVGPDGMPIEDQNSNPIVDGSGDPLVVQPYLSKIVKNYSQGCQCFTGFSPSNEANEFRTVTGAYLDLELDVTDKWLVAGATRLESYLDFGSVLTGKVATRYMLFDGFSIRGSYSTGFRAPSLQEKNYSHTFTYFVNTIPADATIYPVGSAEARVLGIGELKEETSVNMSAGIAAELFDGFSLSVDAYKITIENRIFQTDPFTASEAPALEPLIGDGEAQFRINGGTISSAGLEVVSNYKTGLGTGMLDLTLAATFRKNKFEEATVPELNTNLSDDEIAAKYVQRGSVAQFETGTPSTRIIGTVNYKIGKFNFMVRPSYYGEVTSKANNESDLVDVSSSYDIITGLPEGTGEVGYADQTYSPELIFDLGITYVISSNLRLTVGGNNVFNNLPDIQRYELRDFGIYSNYQQGSGGAYYFSRLSFSF